MIRFLLPGLAGTLLAACAAAGPGVADVTWPGSRWSVVALAGADGALAAVPDGIVVDLAIDAAGARASGSAGCNRWSASASLAGAQVAFGPAAASKRMCGAPEGVMAIEARFLAALGRAAIARADGARVMLSTREGQPVLVLAPAAPE